MVEQGIGVLIVEDDSMVAFLLENAVSSVEGFSMLGVATSLEEMFRVLEEQPVNLVLLDIYLGSQNGLEGLRRIRTKHDGVDVIVVSSDKKADDVALTARLGVFDYITKPFTFERLQKVFLAYKEYRSSLSSLDGDVDQRGVDVILRHAGGGGRAVVEMPKGLHVETLEMIRQMLRKAERPLCSADIQEETGLSASTVSRYLRYLQETRQVDLKVEYRKQGRPLQYYIYLE
ncbi:MAG TPA: response regulator [Synergistaceae bacterium]|nr:response regulator [Synergistaceae bacterium]HPJ25682.1 response regulator [Synergistaceae bacterium]